ncbi:alpha-hydroxy-acid oxidizing enzyme [Cellvibrio zantedeschiae]|uniref:Alpha-hydroxy-acid oxidizing enzyme n=1 Tax=Cellvibrio zantedeschiae TaxID=1237077 RepID=A0ABQ3B077_9GAMM|nr:alpha-hydroxy acid oxidase [Cellvibrio zantedeschiae]GGY69737.1 alpha-hydroxy-acid oxidizing enzyme [Cellvibrio zantedeschiae]
MSEKQQLLSPLNYIPADIQSAQDYEYLARRFIAAPNYEYIAGGSGRDQTLASNLAAFNKWAVCPRILCDVTKGHTGFNLLNREYAHPIFLAPVAYQKLAHPLGEIESARAAEAMQSCFISSTLATQSLETIAATGAEAKWFQLYFQPKLEATLDLVRRAETAGYSALVVTVDASIRMPSLGALRAQFKMPDECVAVNVQHYEINPSAEIAANESRIFQGAMREAPTWADLEWLISETNLPVIVKGVLHPVDALKLKNVGAAGIVVSNHGGRSLDGAPASLDCLAAIRAAVGDDYPVLFDSGIRSGLDIFKAIALGADAVLIGRLQVYALSVAGALGVAHMLRLLREELELCMAQTGCATLDDIRNTRLQSA